MPVRRVSCAHACAWVRSYSANVERLYRSAAIYFDRGASMCRLSTVVCLLCSLATAYKCGSITTFALSFGLLESCCTPWMCHDSSHSSMCFLAHASHHGFWLWLADNVGLPGVSMFFKVRGTSPGIEHYPASKHRGHCICPYGRHCCALHVLHAIKRATCSQPAVTHGLHEKLRLWVSNAKLIGCLPWLPHT